MAETQANRDTVLEATGNRARLAKVYAEALLNAAEKESLTEQIGDELDAVCQEVLGQSVSIQAFFAGALINRQAKLQALHTALESLTSPLFVKFVSVLNQNGRLNLMGDIAHSYQMLRDQRGNKVRVKVRSATELTETQKESLRQTLASQLNLEPILDVRVDPELLGGLITQIGDRVYDSSVRTRLETLRNHLMTSGSHVVQTQRQ